MLIRANDLLAELAEMKSKLMHATFETPPSDYADFCKLVGQYRALTDAETRVRKLARQEDD